VYAKLEQNSLSDNIPVPLAGRRLYVTIWSTINGEWQPEVYFYDTTQ